MEGKSAIQYSAKALAQITTETALSLEERQELILKTRNGRFLYRLYRFKKWGILIFALDSIRFNLKISYLKNNVVEDHTSRVIINALNRYYGNSIEDQIKKKSPGRKDIAKSFFRNLNKISKAFKGADIRSYPEYYRAAKLFRNYIILDALFSRKKPDCVLIARTNDQKRTALGAIAEEYGIPLVAFTVERIGTREIQPFSIKHQLCWSKKQAEFYNRQGIETALMPVPEINEIKIPITSHFKCGLLLNARFDHERVLAFVKELEKDVNIKEIAIRPHPGADLARFEDYLKPFIADWHQPLHEYMDSVDMVFSMDSNVIVDSLLHGIPVVYIGTLDDQKHDLYGFVRDGVIPEYNPGLALPEGVNEFYGSGSYKEKWSPELFTTSSHDEKKLLERFLG